MSAGSRFRRVTYILEYWRCWRGKALSEGYFAQNDLLQMLDIVAIAQSQRCWRNYLAWAWHVDYSTHWGC